MTEVAQPKSPEIRIVNLQPEHLAQLVEMHRLVFPTLTPDEWFDEAKYQSHINLFAEGQFVALLPTEDGDEVVGSTSTLRVNFDFDHIQHTFMEAVGDGWFTNHDPNGEWLYGADLAVHPEYRRRGIGSKLYEARMQLVKRLNLRGEIAGGMMSGYDKHRKEMTVEQYAEAVAAGELTDPTSTMQYRNGFKLRGILYNHITDPRSNDCAALIVRDNPDYRQQNSES